MARVFKVGDDIDTDQLAPTTYVLVSDPVELAKHCLERQRPGLSLEVKPGDVLVGGRNFGCGSSRERAATSVQGLQVKCVIAHSFSRLFFRNAINTGLAILESPEASMELQEGDEVDVDLEAGRIVRRRDGKVFVAERLPTFVAQLVQMGGLVNYARHWLARQPQKDGNV